MASFSFKNLSDNNIRLRLKKRTESQVLNTDTTVGAILNENGRLDICLAPQYRPAMDVPSMQDRTPVVLVLFGSIPDSNPDFDVTQLILEPDVWIFEIDGQRMNQPGDNLIDILKRTEAQTGLISVENWDSFNEGGRNIVLFVSNHATSKIYIRYIGDKFTEKDLADSYLKVINVPSIKDVDKMGVTFRAGKIPTARIYLGSPVFWGNLGFPIGNSYVIEINGVAYKHNLTYEEIIDRANSPAVGLRGYWALDCVLNANPELANIIRVEEATSTGYFVNLTNEELNIRVYVDESLPMFNNNLTVWSPENPTGVYVPTGDNFNFDESYGRINVGRISAPVEVSNNGYAFTLGPNGVAA